MTGRIYPTPTVVDEGGARNLHRTATPGSSRAGGPTCDLWQETGYVFTTAIGLPINTSTDYHAWSGFSQGRAWRNDVYMLPATRPRPCSCCLACRNER